MKTSNEQLYDALLRHQVHLLGYSSYVRNRIHRLLLATEEDIAGKILVKLDKVNALNSPQQWNKLAVLREALAVIRGKAWSEVTDLLMEEAGALAAQEPIFMQSVITGVVPVQIQLALPTTPQLKAIVMSQPFEGRVLKDWARSMAADDVRRIGAAVQRGMAQGESNDAIVRRVIGTSGMKGADGETELTRRQVSAVVRTAVQHIANRARDEFFQSNSDLLDIEYFVATLDGRTTDVCMRNDGERFPLGKGPRPPLHFACRSLRIAGLNASFLGQRPAKPTTEKMLLQEYAESNNLGTVAKRSALPLGHKGKFDAFSRKRVRELVGQVPSKTNYNNWLKGQSVQFQNERLGVTKAKLFRDGGLSLSKFTSVDGKTYTLAQLAKSDADAFIAAGLDPAKY